MNNTDKKQKVAPTMKGEGLPQNPGQAMFPTNLPEGIVSILQQIEAKRNEAITVKLIFDPTPSNYQVCARTNWGRELGQTE